MLFPATTIGSQLYKAACTAKKAPFYRIFTIEYTFIYNKDFIGKARNKSIFGN